MKPTSGERVSNSHEWTPKAIKSNDMTDYISLVKNCVVYKPKDEI